MCSYRRLWKKLDEFSADEVAIQITRVVLGRPDAVGDECPSGDRGAAAVMVIVVDGVGHAGGRRSAVRVGSNCAVPLTQVPAVVCARGTKIDLLPVIISDVVYEEARRERLVEANRNGLRKPVAKIS